MSNDRLAWPILLILLTVLVPSLAVVWMMREAVSNERLAAKERLRDAYEAQLESTVEMVQQQWAAKLGRLAKIANQQPPAQAFQDIVEDGFVDSVLLLGEKGMAIYPTTASVGKEDTGDSDPRWYRAQRLEYFERDFASAAEVYAEIAAEDEDAIKRNTARQARVRCLLKTGEQEQAIAVLEEIRQESKVYDGKGRSLAAAAEFRLLQLLDPESDKWQVNAQRLSERLGNYKTEHMASSQRLFLMAELQAMTPEPLSWPTEKAERLATDVMQQFQNAGETANLQKTTTAGLWRQSSPEGRALFLFREETLLKILAKFAAGQPLPEGLQHKVTVKQEPADALASLPLGGSLGPWRVNVVATDGDLYERTSQQQSALHVWIALLTIGVTCVLGWLLAMSIRRRLQLAQLKNDLVATVSHELKTPLAAIRLLVDTLLEADEQPGNNADDTRTREYLELISKENARLIRLIENFLTFSRLERNKQRFDFQPLNLNDVATKSATLFAEHLGGDTSPLKLRLTGPLLISGDFDSLLTVVVNLLENAWKYSDGVKEIELTTSTEGNSAILSVSDRGIGLSQRDQRRIFDRFYQVDQKVSRAREGCGLGLSIVRAIVVAHDGEVSVESKIGKGSTFQIRLPLAEVKHPRDSAAQLAESTT